MRPHGTEAPGPLPPLSRAGPAELRCALRNAGGAVAALGLVTPRPRCACASLPARRSAMAAAFVLRALYGARLALRCPPAQLPWAPRRGHRLTPADDELYQRTRISLLQRESPHDMYIDSYNSRGFTVGSHRDITEESFSLFWMLEPRIEIVVVGTGDRTERLQSHLLRAMRQRGIAVEVQDTPNACATFNFLCHEGRVTGAALIPPPGGAALTSLAQAAE
ncbi:NADH dehydrogenase [ubiquinone] 1 alpha subcomplex assembly factor 3 isoform X2 [Kogia breviceps]|uniref:NADH dehydrogenase [ubiquinone] 1 alpha subcomplex assembly factor 3 isoform X2 n=1 Tax=Kogia breviceps TaxID=27615 RepID=UPI0034D18C1D